MNAYLDAFRKYAVFSGRTSRRAYWLFVLFNTLALIGLSLLSSAWPSEGLLPLAPAYLNLAYIIGTLTPSVAITTRRLHDTNRSGWWQLISLIPLAGGLILFIFTVLAGDKGPNRFGEAPV